MYSAIYTFENLYQAYHQAAKSKRSRKAVGMFEFKLEENLITLQEELADESYQPGRYLNFTIHEPKKRLISAAPFRDRVVHHALCNLIEPIFERSFIFHSYANRLGKGTHRALDACQQWMHQYRYVLPCDVKQFFPSIDHTILQKALERRLQDGAVRRLVAKILHSGVGVLNDAYDLVYFADDDLFAINRPRGLPIGNLTSQFWANCYMNEFDHFVNRDLGCGAYLRYVDDFLLFANDKKTLWQWRERLIERLSQLRLTLHKTAAQPQPTHSGVRFLGFVVYPTHRLLLRRKGIHFQRKLKTILTSAPPKVLGNVLDRQHLKATIQGWVNHVRYGDTWGLRRSLLSPVRL